jgi:hypothetical protein
MTTVRMMYRDEETRRWPGMGVGRYPRCVVASLPARKRRHSR